MRLFAVIAAVWRLRKHPLVWVVLAVTAHRRLRMLALKRLHLGPEPGHLAPLSTHKAPGSFAQLSFGRTHYRDSGGDAKVTAVMIGGFLTASHCFNGLFDGLVDAGFRAITYDLWGRGWSDSPDVPHTPALYVSQLADLLMVCQTTETPVVLIGLSMGCVVATEFAVRFPDRVAGLVYVSAAGPHFDIGWNGRLVCTPVLGDVLMHLTGARVLDSYEFDFRDPAARNKYAADFSEIHHYHCANNPGSIRSMLSTLRTFPFANRAGLFGLAGTHSRPVLVFWGTLDSAVPIAQAHEILALMPQALLVELPAAGHWALLERADTILSNTVEFMASIEAALDAQDTADETDAGTEEAADAAAPVPPSPSPSPSPPPPHTTTSTQ